MSRFFLAFLFAITLSACSGGSSGISGGSAAATTTVGAASVAEVGGTTATGTVVRQSAGSAVENAAVAPAVSAIATVSHSAQTAASAEILIGSPGGIIVDLSAVANVEAIAKDGTAVGNGGIDGHGDAYSATLLGTTATWSGTAFRLGRPGALDAVSGSTLTLPAGNFTKLNLLAVGVDGNHANQAFVVTYTDGTSAAFTQSLSDWYSPQHYAGEASALTEAYRLYANGAIDNRTFEVFGYTFKLDATKIVQSVKLPANRDVVVLAITLTPSETHVNVAAAGNVEAIDNDTGASLDGGLDGGGRAYSSSLLGPTAAWSGLSFTLGRSGTLGAASSVVLSLPPGNYAAMDLLATGVDGNQPNQHFVVTYTDGTTTTVTQGLSDWLSPQHYAGESVALTESYRTIARGGIDHRNFYVYGYSIELNAGKSVRSVTLPNNRNVVVLAIDLIPVAMLPAGSVPVGPVPPSPPTNPPPADPLAISGSPAKSVVAGSAYAFTPSITAASGAKLTFTVQNAPIWTIFDTTDGRLSGSPSAADVGTYANIIISVGDGTTSLKLAPFSLAVVQNATGSAAVSWPAPTLNTNGTALTNLAGYRIYYGQSAASMTQVVQLVGAGVLSYVVTDLLPGTWFFSVEAYSSTGASSNPSAVVSKTIL
jgi:hypothetical protein